MPFLDQGAAAFFNFFFVFLASVVLSPEEFVFANYGYLELLFAITLSQAFIFQPYLWTTSKSGFANVRATTLHATLACVIVSMVASPLLYMVSKNLGMPAQAIYLTVLILYAAMLYELGRRVNMLRGRWSLNLFCGMSLSALMFLIVLALRPNTASGILTAMLTGYTILGVPMLLFGLVGVFRSPVARNVVGAIPDNPNSYWRSLRYGGWLSGEAIAHWFTTAGYLLVIANLVSTYDFAGLRITQNLMNGIILIFVALENYVLSGHARRLLERPSSVYGYLALMVALYSMFACAAFTLIYPSMRSFAYVFALWAVGYLLFSFAKLWALILKWHGDARSIVMGQISGVAFFMLLISLVALLGLRLSAVEVALFWLLSSLIFSVLVLFKVKVILQRGGSS